MSVQEYRYYCLDRTGQHHSSGLFKAESDEDAVAKIDAKHPGLWCQIWQEKRFVAKLSRLRLRA